MAAASPLDGIPKYKIEMPRPGDNNEYGGTRTVQSAYQYDVGNQIGEGTYGQVFTGDCKKDKVKVALKKIRMDTEKEGFPITAIREIKILSSMKHENVVNLREIVRSEVHKNNNWKGSIYMVFDYAEHDLTGLMDNNKYKFSEAQVKCIMKQLLKGLAYVHGNGVLHRDLKASNILIDKNGIVKLADFGLARTYAHQQDARLTNRVITLWYRPPELLLGAEKYGPEVDMWSVGCILAELLVGKPLFPGKDEMDQLHRIFSIMGTPNEETWPKAKELPNWHMVPKDNSHKGLTLRKWVSDMQAKHGGASISPEAVNLLEKLLHVDPAKRIDALTAFTDEWFWNHNPPACDPYMLPCSGSSHEFTMKNRKRQQEHDAGRQHGGGHAHVDKRGRYGAPPAGGVSGGYGGGMGARPQGGPPHQGGYGGPAARGPVPPSHQPPGGLMGPPQRPMGGGYGGYGQTGQRGPMPGHQHQHHPQRQGPGQPPGFRQPPPQGGWQQQRR